MKIFLAPHCDDEILFGLDILVEEKPLVIIITHATEQGDNGYERALESYRAIKDLGLSICYLQIMENELTDEVLEKKLEPFKTEGTVYVPDTSDNEQHNLVKRVAEKIFNNISYYNNYLNGVVNKETDYPELKKEILKHYTTQINNKDTAHYFV